MSDWGDEFRGRKVVLTGACGVIGNWIAQAFASAGARLCRTAAGKDRLFPRDDDERLHRPRAAVEAQ